MTFYLKSLVSGLCKQKYNQTWKLKSEIKIMSKMNKIKSDNLKKQSIPIPHPTQKLNAKDKISLYLTNIEDKIIKEIDEQKQKISQHNHSSVQKSTSHAIKFRQQQLKKLTEEKSKTQNKLKQLSDKQFQLKYDYRMKVKNRYLNKAFKDNQRSELISRTIDMKRLQKNDPDGDNQFMENEITFVNLNPKSVSLTKFRPKSQLTQDDIQTLKTLKKQYVKFEQQLIQKTKKHDQQIQKIKKQNLQLKQLIKKQKNQQKKNQIQQKLQLLEKQKLQRIEKFNQQQIKLSQIKRKPKIHQKLTKQFQQKQKAINEQKILAMKQRLKNKMFDTTEIKQHQKKYEELRSQQLKSIEEKYLQQSRILKESKIEPEKISKFYKSVLMEEKQKKNEKKRKQLASIQKCQRIKEFAAKVYEEHYPRVKSKEDVEQQSVKSQQVKDRSLSIEEMKQLGNNYLKEAIKSLKQNKKIKSPLTTTESTQKESQLPKISSLSKKYKDYLSQQRERYKSDLQRSQAKQRRARQKYLGTIQEVKKIMNEDSNLRNKHKTIEKIQHITQRLEHQPNDRNYIDKIRAKLQILQTIT